MNVWVESLIAVILVSLVSLVGIFFIFLKEKKLEKFLLGMVSFSAGALFGGAFLHLIPEAVEKLGFNFKISLFIILGILFFFVLEKFIFWRHCHIPTSHNHPHPFGLMNVVGDGFHNLIDGLVIGASFLVNPSLGIATTFAVIIHEIPQEISDFGVLLHSGMSKGRALFLNFISALMAVVGVLISLIFVSRIEGMVPYLLALTAGGFIYIAGSDLIPELKKETGAKKSFWQFFWVALGIVAMALMIVFE